MYWSSVWPYEEKVKYWSSFEFSGMTGTSTHENGRCTTGIYKATPFGLRCSHQYTY
jgi:hypothetical protein